MLNPCSPQFPYSSYLNYFVVVFTPTKKKKKKEDVGRAGEVSIFAFVICSILLDCLFLLKGEFMTNRQSIILRYENVVTKVNKLSYDTFLKTIGAEMNAPGRSESRLNILLY